MSNQFIEITDTKGDQYVIRLEDIHHLSRIYGKNSVNMVDKFIFSVSAEEYERVKRELLHPLVAAPASKPLYPANLTMEAVAAAGGLRPLEGIMKLDAPKVKPLVHIRSLPSFHTMCGEGLNENFLWDNDRDIESEATCPECLELWRSRR